MTADTAVRRRITLTGAVTWTGLWAFIGGLLIAVTAVVLSSFTQQLSSGWLPGALTTKWYSGAWSYFDLPSLLTTTLLVALAVVALSLLVAVPTAFALSRLSFPGKRLVMLLFLVPQVIPTMSYAVPLATLVYQLRLNDTVPGLVLVNLVPSLPFAVLVLIPFVDQIDPRVEQAARVFGAGTRQVFVRILAPLMVPGLLAAGVLTLVRVVGQFELTFLVAGPNSQTIVVALFGASLQAGQLPSQQIDAMAVIYMLTTLVLLLIALRFVDPTSVAARTRR
ncbi:spermidine/putrescine ABC transporter permease [Sphaerisporangium melleum]|uniref:Spermidine/putrescine ABC transporter permease n=1 Tax=Sphaerisporangium melleum TaxID=321316 RepID=A0A917RP35_9ACTN|nr:ABC transporter permease subunit [Sphaerisporangium melleum]GGL17666.1 spermidine/putrescine ABC transporter permease [Sphaerisporangium melleum]GII74835.1 spermidine/putrescine ABC transporter permease [Sphaerisporangium melleum]